MESRIEQVVVFPDRALVRRQCEVELATGIQLVEIPGLPLTMHPDSVRVIARSVTGSVQAARARLLGVQVQTEFFSQAPVERVRELESQVEATQDELAILDRRLELVSSRRQQVGELMGQSKVFARALAAGEMDIESKKKLFASLLEQAASLDSDLGEMLGEKRDIEKHLAQLKNQLEQLNSTRPPERLKVVIEVEVISGGKFQFQLSYTVTKASWKAIYDFRIGEDGGKTFLEIGFLAQVVQLSGEDWHKVDLALSTARPAMTASLPELKPWFIQPLPPVPSPIQARPPMRTAAIAASRETALASKSLEEPLEVAVSQVEVSGVSTTYHTPGKADIPSDGSAHKVSVGHFSLEPKMDYICAPRLVEAVYRRARMVNESEYLLLPGMANLFSGDEFIGSTTMEMTAPKGEFELGLGVEDRIKVERELKRREVDKSLIGGKRRVHYGYDLRLENLLSSAVNVIVYDQMPVGKHEGIKVKLERADPKPNEGGELNLLDWDLSLAPGVKKSIRFDFVVEYPQEMQVVGLP